jgi:murein DD-endopeptidase MepM/ murein hydrolase activator NlpD
LNIWPTESKKITSRFGYRRDPFTKRKSFHAGIDIGGQINDPVYATAAGKVVAAGYQRAMGYYVAIDHGNGLQTRYLHLNKILVRPGSLVEKGQRIALLGNTGRSTGPHLHFEIIKNGQLVDPLSYLQAATH